VEIVGKNCFVLWLSICLSGRVGSLSFLPPKGLIPACLPVLLCRQVSCVPGCFPSSLLRACVVMLNLAAERVQGRERERHGGCVGGWVSAMKASHERHSTVPFSPVSHVHTSRQQTRAWPWPWPACLHEMSGGVVNSSRGARGRVMRGSIAAVQEGYCVQIGHTDG